ncbi:glycosyltransferase [Solitalea lacus]|uniref:glycosyltransferase n=1 Tax=Solitalea lacus TaxID=2911172 RepID=UPI001EDC26C5|nr:glycosyltransferase [Solitalea lacus]UKJ07541.1 glycosyltransferase family 2 protein [Solitalea lacus]
MTTIDQHNPIKLSVIICCFNSSKLLGPTLQALSLQKKTEPFSWEIIVVDNNSSDNTFEFAENEWKQLGSPFKLLVVREPNAGLMNAREKGKSVSSGEILIFCDDDNRLNENYVATVINEFENDQKLAALGGRGIPVFETEKPKWFDKYAINYAVGKQKGAQSVIKNLYGAGIALRKSYLQKLYDSGFEPKLIGRKGSILLAGEDTELVFALQFMDVNIGYNDDLTFEHYLTSKRLNFDYLCEMRKGIGAAQPILNLYKLVHANKQMDKFYYLRQLIGAYTKMIKQTLFSPTSTRRTPRLTYNQGYIQALKDSKAELHTFMEEIQNLQLKLKKS